MGKPVQPVFNRYWIREEYSHGLIPTTAGPGIAGLALRGPWMPWRRQHAGWPEEADRGARPGIVDDHYSAVASGLLDAMRETPATPAS